MWIVAGLGNPGKRYKKTRHNLGFEVVDLLAKRWVLSFKEKDLYEIAKGLYRQREVVLVKPLTFMNLSGEAIKAVKDFYKISPQNIIVVHDDLDLPPGRIKLKKGGSSGGHKGVQSIIDRLSDRGFLRVKLGIGKPEDEPIEGYVLRKPSAAEAPLIEEAIEKAADAVEEIIVSGIDIAMNIYNKKE